MPWKDCCPMDERMTFIAAWQKRQVSFSALCRQFSICRPTGYKWVDRFLREGEAGLREESRAPYRQPNLTPVPLQNQILALRQQHPTWGPRKLLAVLRGRDPRSPWPAASTIGDLLRREGLAHPRPPRRRTPPFEQPLAHAQAPNDVWCADFKGWFVCGNGERCDPLTLTDAYSRFLLRCRAVPKTDSPHVQAVFDAAFREFGLPTAIRTDNGPPFASHGLAGLSRLAVWWIRLGIHPERIDPGCPQQNGRHERFHQTLLHDVASPPQATLARQQKAFLAYETLFNHQRPHEALGQRPPAEFYRASSRPCPPRLPELAYPFACSRKLISAAGHFSWRGILVYVSILLEGQHVALRPLSDHELFEVHFGPLLLGWFHAPSATFTALQPPPRRQRRFRPTY